MTDFVLVHCYDSEPDITRKDTCVASNIAPPNWKTLTCGQGKPTSASCHHMGTQFVHNIPVTRDANPDGRAQACAFAQVGAENTESNTLRGCRKL